MARCGAVQEGGGGGGCVSNLGYMGGMRGKRDRGGREASLARNILVGAEKKKRKMGRMERAYGESRLHRARGGSERIGGRGAECCGDGEVAEHHHHNILRK